IFPLNTNHKRNDSEHCAEYNDITFVICVHYDQASLAKVVWSSHTLHMHMKFGLLICRYWVDWDCAPANMCIIILSGGVSSVLTHK
ncbi:hypothetical protein HW555_009950, partial [Spodoptera exigua]